MVNPIGMSRATLAPDAVPVDLWHSSRNLSFELDPAMVTTGRKLLPWPRGRLVGPNHLGSPVVVYNPKGPGASPLKSSGGVDQIPSEHSHYCGFHAGSYVFHGGLETSTRPLLPEEIWASLGHQRSQWKCLLQRRPLASPVSWMSAAVRSASMGSARTVVTGALLRYKEATAEGPRAGMCVHPEEVEVQRKVEKFFEAWRVDPDQPVNVTASWWKKRAGGGSSRAGGRRIQVNSGPEHQQIPGSNSTVERDQASDAAHEGWWARWEQPCLHPMSLATGGTHPDT